MQRLLRILDGVIWLLFGLFFVWTLGTLWYWPTLPWSVCVLLLIAFVGGTMFIFYRSSDAHWARSCTIALIFVVYLLSVVFLRPSNDRDWAADHSRVATVEIEGGNVTVHNFRHCRYRSELDYDANFETKRFPLSSIQSVWFIVQKFTADEGLAHVFLSFGLTEGHDPEYFSVSVEIRREVGESYSPLRGLYRTYELTHVIGAEEDLIGVRTIHRPNDRVFMYRVNATPQQAQELFKKFAERITNLNEQPQFYNTFLNNCANGITGLTYELTPEPINWLDPRIVFPGHGAEFGFEKGLIGERKRGQAFKELESNARIDVVAKRRGAAVNFSKAIRER